MSNLRFVWSDEDDCYLVYADDLEGRVMQPIAHGKTMEEALCIGSDVYRNLKELLDE